MKSIEKFIVELNKTTEDRIITDSGIELFVDTRFKEFEHRVTGGPVVSPPAKWDTGVQTGDTLYFHHLVVMNEGQCVTGVMNHYEVNYTEKDTLSCQAIAYSPKDSDEIIPIGGWVLLEGLDGEPTLTSSTISLEHIKPKKKKKIKEAVLSFETPATKDLGLTPGDVVGFKGGYNYRIKIKGTEYSRIRDIDLLYKSDATKEEV